MPEREEQHVGEVSRTHGSHRERSDIAESGPADPRLVSTLLRLSRGAGAFAVVVGTLVLAGWALDVMPLKSVSHSWVTMKPNAALAFVLSGMALWMLQKDWKWPGWRIVASACATAVAAIGILTLSQDLAGWNLGIDQLLFSDPSSAIETTIPGRMAPTTALNFLLLGGALLFLAYPVPGRQHPAAPLAFGVLIISGLAVLGYAYGVAALYRVAVYGSMAAHTSVTFIVLSLGVLFACARQGWVSLLVSRSGGGILLREAWLPGTLFLVLFGGLRLRLEQAGLFGTEFGLALMVLTTILVLTVLLWRSAILLDKSDAERGRETEAHAQLATIVKTSGDAIISCTPNGIVLSWNAGAEKLLGYSAAEMVGHSLSVIAPPDRRHETQHHAWLLQRGQSVPPFETIRIASDGHAVDVQMSMSAIRDAAGGITQIAYIFRDITERKRAEEAAREGQRRLATLMDNLPGVAYRCRNDPQWTVEFISDGCLDVTGYRADEFLENKVTSFGAIMHPDDAQPIWEKCQANLAAQQPCRSEYRIIHRNGEIRWVWDQARGIYAGSGELLFIEGMITDITERKLAATTLRESEERFRATFEQAAVGIAHVAPDGRWLHVNQKLCDIVGYSREELLQKTFQDITHPDDLDADLGQVRQMLGREINRYSMEKRYFRKSGEVVWINLTVSLLWKPSGEPDYFISVVEDISERKRAEVDLAQLAAIVESSRDAIISVARDGTILTWNPGAEHLFGHIAAEVVGRNISSLGLIPDDRRDEFGKTRTLALAGQKTEAFETERLAKDGHRISVSISSSPIRDSNGNIAGVASIYNDITERKRTEQTSAQLAAIVEGSNDAIIGRALDGTITSWNSGAERLYGYTAAEAIGRRALLLTPPELHAETERNRKQLRQGTPVPPYETVRLTKDGRRVAVELSLSPIRNRDGGVVGQSSISRDITERKQAEQARANLAAIVENSNDAIIGRSLDGTITSWNAGAERLLGYSASEAIGRPIAFSLPPGQHVHTAELNERLLRGEEIAPHETRRRTRDGRMLDVMSSISPLKDANGKVVGASQILHDITARKQAEEHKARLAAIVENSNDAIVSRGTDGTILSWNPAAERLFGWSAAEAIGAPISIFIPPGRQDEVRRNMEKLHRGEPVAAYDTVRRKKDGQLFDAALTQSPIKNERGEVIAVSLIFRDITERKRADTALQESEERFRAAFEQAGVGMGLRALDSRKPRWLRVNQKLCEIFGYTRDELLQLTTVDLTPPEDRGTAIDYNEKLLRGEVSSYTREKRYVHKDGRIIWTNVSVAAVHAPDGRPTHVISVIEDITEHKQAEERASFLAQYDVVTGLPNHQLFTDRLTLAMARDKRLGTTTALLLLDLDRFKLINETLGHGAGDEALQMVTARLRERLREVDTIARLGGDEFVVILESVAETAHALRVAEKIMGAMAEPLVLKGEEVFITASIGIALYPADAGDVEKLIECAELAMYQAKKEGRNTVQLYTPDRESRRGTGLGMESRLRRALERDELLLHYQPKVDVRTGSITSAEALVRWRNPDLGLVSPADFIPLAEETGLIVPIGEWVLHSACTQASAWRRQGHPLAVAVNLSARQFRQNDLCETVERALADSALDAGRLELEITESMIMHRPEQTIATLQRLHEIGVKLSIDDFGTGYSSLSYLKRFPVHTLKIDQSFVRELHKNADDAAIVRAVIALAQSLNLKTVAEGVETEQQLIFLAGLHCDEYQGYYFSKPLPPAEFLQLLQARSSAAPVMPLSHTAKAARPGSREARLNSRRKGS